MGVKHHSPRWKAVRLAARRRDGFKCTGCGARGRLEVHHVKPARKHPELAYELSNVTTLCVACHIEETRKQLGIELSPSRREWRELLTKGIANVEIHRNTAPAV